MNYFIIFEFFSLEYGNTDTKIVSASHLSEEIKQVTEFVMSQLQVMRELYINNFLIFDIPDLK